MRSKCLITVVLSVLSLCAISQNIVLSVTGKVVVKGQNARPLQKGDNLKSNVKLDFLPDAATPKPEIKLLTPKGICAIRLGDYQSRPQSELTEFINLNIHKVSVATLGTRAMEVAPDANRQVALVDSLCRLLNTTAANVEEVVATYINPYCVAEFKQPYWAEILAWLQQKYQYRQYTSTGDAITAEEYNTIPRLANLSTRAFLPAAASLKKYCPTPGNQGQYGTCVGWASAYGARTISWAVKNNMTATVDITNQAFSPSFIYEQAKTKGDDNCQDGAYISTAVALLKNSGVPFYSDLGFQCNANLTPYKTAASNYTIKDFYALTEGYGLFNDEQFKKALTNIKTALSEKKPVLASIKCYSSFKGKIWDGKLDNYRGGHAICIVGYDDQFANGEGAVELMNSWGPYWGNGGFIYVKYADLKNILNAAIALYDDARPAPLEPDIPPTPKPKPGDVPRKDTIPVVIIDTLKRMEGSFRLVLKDNTEMPIMADEVGTRGLSLARIEEMTYNVAKSYPSGTLFKIEFTSNQPAYVYVIGTDSKKSPLAQLFPDPDQPISALLDFKSKVGITIPDGNMYIEMDPTVGEDYLCVIYSKDPLDISSLRSKLQNNPGKSFVTTVKEAFAGKIVDDGEITFEKKSFAFKAASKHKTVVPVFVKIKHN